jgi:hypothetical protein
MVDAKHFKALLNAVALRIREIWWQSVGCATGFPAILK